MDGLDVGPEEGIGPEDGKDHGVADGFCVGTNNGFNDLFKVGILVGLKDELDVGFE